MMAVFLTPTLVVGCCVSPEQRSRSRKWADGSRTAAVHQTDPEGSRERMPHRHHRRPLLLHYRYAAEELAQVHRSHRGREPKLLNLEMNNVFPPPGFFMWSYGAPCLRINPQTVVFSAIDVLHVSPAEESCCQIHQSWACGKLPDELPQVINTCNHLWVDSNPGMIQIAAVVETFELLHRHMIDLSHIDVSLTDGWGSRREPGSLCRFTRLWQNVSSAPPLSTQRSFALSSTTNSETSAATFWLLNWHRRDYGSSLCPWCTFLLNVMFWASYSLFSEIMVVPLLDQSISNLEGWYRA